MNLFYEFFLSKSVTRHFSLNIQSFHYVLKYTQTNCQKVKYFYTVLISVLIKNDLAHTLNLKDDLMVKKNPVVIFSLFRLCNHRKIKRQKGRQRSSLIFWLFDACGGGGKSYCETKFSEETR